ncbi:hypothetical protein LIER_01979 [Lithospermum erythrorhizon]|uniref:Uncharacterized protein n=1 Tax=Lithospermum erythrorhizon TaxID=34254 RepID=A0AAV3NSD4_LITER
MSQFPVAVPLTEGLNQSVVPVIPGPSNPEDLAAAVRADGTYQDELLIACPLEDVDFDAMLGERPSFFTSVKPKSKKKPRASMVPAGFAPAAPPPLTSIPAPVVNPVLKRVADNIPALFASLLRKRSDMHPKKIITSKVLARDSEEGTVHSQGSASPVGLVAPQATPPAPLVDFTFSATLSDHGMGQYGDQNVGNLPRQVELSQPFPLQREPNVPEEEFRQRKGKAIMVPMYTDPLSNSQFGGHGRGPVERSQISLSTYEAFVLQKDG